VLPLDSTREGDAGWRLRARNSGQDGAATAYVYCGKGGLDLTTVSSQDTIANQEAGSVAAQ
jgi:hypothetical protein